MDENAGAEIAALREEIAALAERVSVLTAQLHDAASPAVGSDVDAKLARAARLAALRGVDAGRRQPD